MKLKEILYHRLLHQQLLQPKFDDAAAVVRWLGAMQAQDYLSSLWAIGIRTKNATESDVEKAIVDRKIVRSWPLRGTLHFVAAENLRWMLDLSKARINAKSAKRLKTEFNLDEKVFTRCKKIFEKELRDGVSLSRDYLYTVLEKSKIATGQQRGLHIVSRLARDGFICFGARQGKQHTFVLLDEWIKPVKKITRIDALVRIAKRYFISHGPATLQDFTWWSGLAPSEAKLGLEEIKSELCAEKIDEEVYWMTSETLSVKKSITSTFLLPSFDEYIISYADRSAALEHFNFQKMVFTANGIFNPIVVINGKVCGIWKRSFKKDIIEINLTAFNSFTESQRKTISLAAKGYADFVGSQVRLKK